MMIIQSREKGGTEIEVETDTGTSGERRTGRIAATMKRHTSRDDREIPETTTDDDMLVMRMTTGLTTEVERSTSPTPGLDQDLDHLAANHTASAIDHAHARLDARLQTLGGYTKADEGPRAQHQIQTHSRPSLALFHRHQNRLSAPAVEVPSKPKPWALSRGSPQIMILPWT